MTTILMTEEYWANSPFSIARHYGGIRIRGVDYIIVNKEGKDLFECSYEAEKEGRKKAIEPGEPADLIRSDFKHLYSRLGRDRFMEILLQADGKPASEVKAMMEKDLSNLNERTD